DDLLLAVELFPEQPGDNGVYFVTPTPGEANSEGFAGYVGDTTFSHDRGIYDTPFEVTITSATPDAVIYYTLDNSTPGPGSNTYSTPISISETSVLRAIAVKTDHVSSNIDTQTYGILLSASSAST
ncbi:MAG: hypothetical protein GY949_10985, partial [Gammaproteobacteria bacterium]|nr:hypothetical protein [Gammaproteobacteria bacterium]